MSTSVYTLPLCHHSSTGLYRSLSAQRLSERTVCVCVCVCVCVYIYIYIIYKIIRYVFCCRRNRVTDIIGHFHSLLFMCQYKHLQLNGPQLPQENMSNYLADFKSRSANKYVLKVLSARVLDKLRTVRLFTWNIPTRRNAPSIT